MRVAIAGALAEVAETAPEAGEPLVQAAHLAFAERRQPGDPAGEAPVALLRLGGDQMLDAEGVRDRAGDEAVGRGDDCAQVALLQVAAHQRARRRQHHRRDALAHELAVPGVERLGRVVGERPQRKAEEFVDVQRAGLVLLVERTVLRFVVGALEHAAIDQELAPLVVAVAGEQRVVEVEQGQAHERPEFTSNGKSELQNRRCTPMRKSRSCNRPEGSRDSVSALSAQSCVSE